MGHQQRITPTPQLALRVAAFGIIAFGVFAVLFLRLWFLQVLQGDQYRAQATQNGQRIVRIAAPRGSIVDRNTEPLVDNRVEVVVALRPSAVPEADRDRIATWGQEQGAYDVARARTAKRIVDAARDREAARERARTPTQRARRRRREERATLAEGLARQRVVAARRRAVLDAADRRAVRTLARTGPRDPATLTLEGSASPRLRALLRRYSRELLVPARRLYRRIVAGVVRQPFANIPLKSSDVRSDQRNYLLERGSSFPELVVGREYRRHYVDGGIAAQLYGNIGEITEDQLAEDAYDGLRAGQRIGQDGLEYEYNAFLQGRDGADLVEVDAQGRPTGRSTPRAAVPGSRLKLTLDRDLQEAGEAQMARTISGGLDAKTGFKAAGSFAAIDPRNGEVLALGSYPTVDLNRLSRPSLSRRRYARTVDEEAGSPLLDRATRGQYAIGSTFKIVTALAGLSTGIVTPSTQDAGGSCIEIGREKRRFCNAEEEDLGPSNLERALQVSSDVYFYAIGRDVFSKPRQPLQAWARAFGFGRRTGIDLPGEASGVIPDAAWRRGRNAAELACRKQRRVADCGLVGDVTGGFLQGDEVNLAIGQGDFLATPLQVARAYAGLYDPGAYSPDLHVPTPHLGLEIEDAQGRLDRRIPAAPRRTVRIPDPTWKRTILRGLQEVTSTSDGTAGRVFAGWDQGRFPVLGKTGTAQRCNDSRCPDQAWFVGMVPDRERPIVVVATVENGEYGATTAAPIVCRMLRHWYRQSPTTAPCRARQGGTNTAE